MKRALSFLLIVIMMISIVPFSAYALNNSEMSIYFIDCGQGDAIFITSKDESMLVDAGKASKVQKVLDFLNSKNVDEINYVFSSHPDEDHIGGMPEVYECYQINNSFYSPYIANTTIYQKYMDAVKNEPNSNFSIADENDTFTLGDAKIDVLSDGKNYSNANDASLVLKVTCGEKSLLLTGDISKTVEQDLIDSDENIDVDILKVAHHGSASSSSSEFLVEVSPDVAVISVGEGNSYGHPTQEALQRLSSVCDNIYRTDENGTILLEVSENTVTYNNNILETTEKSYCTARTVYVTSSGKKYHESSSCSNMKNPIAKSLTEAKNSGYTACNKCVSSDFETSKIPHTYTSDCDSSCNACGEIRTASAHVYDNNCDSSCNICNDVRMSNHKYDNDFDSKCNVCGAERTAPNTATRSFVDVASNAWFKYYVDYAVAYGLFSGTSDTTFSPNADMTRAQFVQVLANLSGAKLDNSKASGFSDAPAGKWFTGAVKWAVDNGIASGIGNGKFNPTGKIDRQQMCMMLVNYVENYKKTTLKEKVAYKTFADDKEIAGWAKTAVIKCFKAGLVSGTGNNKFSPKVVANRATGATIFTNFHKEYIA